MKVNPITTTEPKTRKHSVPMAAAAGAVVGGLSRFVLPEKNLLNKNTLDTFVSSAAKRGADRSILKYSGIGALVATAGCLFAKVIDYNKKNSDTLQYTKLGTLVDSPDYACEILWYGDK